MHPVHYDLTKPTVDAPSNIFLPTVTLSATRLSRSLLGLGLFGIQSLLRVKRSIESTTLWTA
jgi:hypothetical protein